MNIKLIDGVEFTQIVDTGILLDMNNDLFYALDDIGATIMNAIINLSSLELVLTEFKEQFSEEKKIEKTIIEFICDLSEKSLIKVDNPLLLKNTLELMKE